jgi:hypothetical protein
VVVVVVVAAVVVVRRTLQVRVGRLLSGKRVCCQQRCCCINRHTKRKKAIPWYGASVFFDGTARLHRCRQVRV